MCRPGFRHGYVQGRIYRKLDDFATANQFARVTVDSGVITERRPDSVRGPDVAVWSYDRLPKDQLPIGYPEVAADLCVEVLSPNDRPGEVRDKVREYFARGVRMVWVADPEDRAVRVHRGPDEAQLLYEAATLKCDDVLPGFSCRVSEFFD
jgi:Uma2 family endonuclease